MIGHHPCDEESALPMLLDGSHSVVIPEVLPTICKLLLRMHEGYRKTALQHLVFLITNDAGLHAFLRRIGWQSWLFDLILEDFIVHSGKVIESGDRYRSILGEMVLKLLIDLLSQGLNEANDGWMLYSDTLA